MLTLAAGQTLHGVAGSATAITYTLTGDEKATADAFKVLAQGQLPSSIATLYTAPALTATLVQRIFLQNTTAGAVTVTLAVNGTAAANRIASFSIGANGFATFTGDGWKIYDANGAATTSAAPIAATGDATGSQSGTNLPLTLATVNANTGSWGTASSVPQFTVNGKGLMTAAANVSIAITAGQVSGLNAMATNNLTGDITSVGAATTLATVNSNVGSFGTATQVSAVTVNAKGLVIAAANTAIQIAESQVTNLVTDLAGKQPTGNYITALTTDVTASGAGSVAATIAANAVTNTKAADMAAHTIKGNNTASTADPIDLTLAQVKTELSLTGTNSGDQTITLTGDVGGSGTGSFAATIAADVVDNTKLANMAQATFKMRAAAAGTGDPIDGTPAQAKTALAIANTDVSGLGTLSTVSALTGDITSSGAATTLATVNSNVGSFGSASAVGTFTVNAKGLVTAAGTTSIVIPESAVTNLVTDLAAKQPTGNYLTAITGDLAAAGPGSSAGTLATVNANVGTFGSSTLIPVITVNGKGLITAASTVAGGGGGGGNDFAVVTGNTGTANADAAGDTIAITGTGAVTTTAADTPDGLVISLVADGVTDAMLADMAANTMKGNFTNALANPTNGALAANQIFARASTGDISAKTITDAGLTWLTHVASANQTAALDLATTTLKGLLSAADKKIIDNLHYDFVADFAGVGNDSTDNLTMFNNAISTMPAGSTLFIPPGTYRVSGEITIAVDKKITFKGGGRYATIIKTTSATANIFNISAVAWRNTWVDLGFLSTVNKTAGACIAITLGQAATFPTNTAVGNNVYRCWFSSDGGGTIFQAINYTGWQAGNLAVLADLDISGISNGGRGIFIFGSTINIMIHNVTINCGAATTSACCEIQASGAVQVTGCDWIMGTNVMLFNAATQLGAQACYFTNTFFDQPQADVISIIGGFTTGRIKFTQCGIATATSGFAAVKVAGTGAGGVGTATALPAGISIVDCDIYHAAGSSTGAGVLINGCQDINIQSSRITGYSGAAGAGISAVASASGQTKVRINGCIIGPNSNLTVTNLDAVKLSGTFGALSVTDNTLTGNTTAINDTSTMSLGAQKNINNNAGALAGFNTNLVSAAGFALSATEVVVVQVPAPANSIKVGTTIKVMISGTSVITVTTTLRLHVGTAGTTADAQLVQCVSAAAPATSGGFVVNALFQITAVGATTSAAGNAHFVASTGSSAVAPTFPSTAAATTVANYITVGALCSAAGHTVRAATMEIISPS